jgi:thymidylate synthase, flavin-dependent
MKIIKPSIKVLSMIDGISMLKQIEKIGRICYKSEDKISEESAIAFVKGLIKRGHEAVLEHEYVTIKFICDRGVSHEIVRHRIASYCQESTRYCNYSKNKFDEEITVILPTFFDTGMGASSNSNTFDNWKFGCKSAEQAYFNLLRRGATPEQARTVLPNSLKTELVVTMNLREWRYFFKLRTDRTAHPQIVEVAAMALRKLQKEIPIVFDDIDY